MNQTLQRQRMRSKDPMNTTSRSCGCGQERGRKELSFLKEIESGREPLFHESIKQTQSMAVREANMTIYISSSPWNITLI